MKEYKIKRYDEQKATEKELKAYYDFFMEILAEARMETAVSLTDAAEKAVAAASAI